MGCQQQIKILLIQIFPLLDKSSWKGNRQLKSMSPTLDDWGPSLKTLQREQAKLTPLQDHVWGRIQPLGEGESPPNLLEYLLVGLTIWLSVPLTRVRVQHRIFWPGCRCLHKMIWLQQRDDGEQLLAWDAETKTWPNASVVDDSEEVIAHESPVGPQLTLQPTGEFHEVTDHEEDLNRIDSWVGRIKRIP